MNARSQHPFGHPAALPVWPLGEAKARFSEVVRRARSGRPQRVTVHRKDAVVVVAAADFDRLRASRLSASLHELLSESPLNRLQTGRRCERGPRGAPEARARATGASTRDEGRMVSTGIEDEVRMPGPAGRGGITRSALERVRGGSEGGRERRIPVAGPWLLGVSVLLELRKIRPDPRVRYWADAQPAESLFVSSLILAQVRNWIARQGDPEFRDELASWLDRRFRPWFAERILPVDEEVLRERLRMGPTESGPDSSSANVPGGRHGRAAPRSGRSRAEISNAGVAALLAATGRVHGLTVCTDDERAFLGLDARVFNPWSA